MRKRSTPEPTYVTSNPPPRIQSAPDHPSLTHPNHHLPPPQQHPPQQQQHQLQQPQQHPPPAKRHKPLRKSDLVRHDHVPQWLHDAAAAFVASTPPLNWTGGFYSWGTWLDHLRSLPLWTPSPPLPTSATSSSSASSPAPLVPGPPPWRVLIDACRLSGQVRGTAALYRAKSDLVSDIINLVYRRAEAHRVAQPSQTPAPERDVMRRVRAVVTRQRRHEAVGLTLIRFLDLAFVFSAYKDCCVALAAAHSAAHPADPKYIPHDVARRVEAELAFFERKPNARDIRNVTIRMQTFMWHRRWLPWYEQVPDVRNEMAIRAREAALAFCEGLPFPELHVRAGVRGLSRDHLAGAGSMDAWLVGLFDREHIHRWARLAEVYEAAVRDEKNKEDPLMEETARRVIERVLEPLTEVKEGADAAHSKLVDAAPGIVVTQSVRIAGRLTFRQLLELYIHLAMFGQFLHTTFYGCSLPSIEQIHSCVIRFEEIKSRMQDVRPLIDADKVDRLFEWCLATTDAHKRDTHSSLAAYGGCIAYQRAAIRAALGPSVLLLPSHTKIMCSAPRVGESDPLGYAAVIAEWDPALAAKVVDASVRIGRSVRNKFMNGRGGGLDLYTHRRVIVCDAARERFRGDVRLAARVMSRLHAVWEMCEGDKGVGEFDGRGAMTLKMAVDKDNFEAASAFGLLLCSDEWEERRKRCNLERNMEVGLKHICKAIAMGDTAAAGDLVYLLQCRGIDGKGSAMDSVSSGTIQQCVGVLKEAAGKEASISLFLGYLYSVGGRWVEADCALACREYEQVLRSTGTSTQYQAFAANNLGTLKALMAGEEGGSRNGSVNGETDNGTGGSAGDAADAGGNGPESAGGSEGDVGSDGGGGGGGNCPGGDGAAGDRRKAGGSMRSLDYFKVAASAGNERAASNLAAVLCVERAEGKQDLELAAKMYGRMFNGPVQSAPITVIQPDHGRQRLRIAEVVVKRERQTRFCERLACGKLEEEELSSFGMVVSEESLPFVVRQ